MKEKPFYHLEKEDQLTLIVKSKNLPGVPVFREDLPKVLFNRAPRTLLGQKWFTEYSKKYFSPVCQCCLANGSLERHEVYSLYRWNQEYLVKLERVLWICNKCHSKIHGGYSSLRGSKYGFIPGLAPVSDAMSNKYPWNKAKFILIGGDIYLL